MQYRELTLAEEESIFVGEAITIGAIMAILTAAVMAVVIYKMFTSNKGTTTVPGGWKFTWN